MKRYKNAAMALVFAIGIAGIAGCGTSYPTTTGVEYTNPSWAPEYVSGVRYYYLPDIETYYDLSNQDFAYLDNGQWIFSSSLPPMYSNYDLYNGFSVSLNHHVYQPWMHNQYYLSNYPRYYYHNKYPNARHDGIRGFNENNRMPIVTRPPINKNPVDRRNDDFRNQNNINGQPQPTRPTREVNQPQIIRPTEQIRQPQPTRPVQEIKQPQTTRPAQTPAYPGRNIGQPVRVRPSMRQPKTENRIQPVSPKVNQQGGRINNKNERLH